MLFSKEVPKEDGVYWACGSVAFVDVGEAAPIFEPFCVEVMYCDDEEEAHVFDAFVEDGEDYTVGFLMFGDKIEVPTVSNDYLRYSTKHDQDKIGLI